MKKTLLLLACLFLIQVSAQNININNASGPNSVTGCTPSGNFSFIVNNTPNNFTATDVVHLNFIFAQGIQLNQVTSNAGTIDVIGNSITVSDLNGISNFEIHYSIQLNCNFPSNNTVFNTHSIDYYLNANSPQTFNYSSPYACTQSVIVFDGGTNLNYNNAFLNIPFTRTYVFKNSSGVPFTGSFAFDDNTFYTTNSTFHFTNISSPSSGNITVTGSVFTASNTHIELQVTNLQQGESFQITEEGYLAECSGALDFSKTVFTAKFGCNASDLCKDVESSISKEAVTRVSQRMPDVQFTNDLHSESCINLAPHKTYTITNVGLGAANKATLTFAPGGFGPMLTSSYFLDNIDQNSISVAINGVLVPTSYSTSASGYYAYINVIGNIEPGQSVVIQYDEVFNCIPAASYDDYFNKTAILHSFHPISVSLSHPCLGDDVFLPGNFYSHPQELLQTFTNLNGQMLGGPPSSAWFVIDNATPLVLGNYLQASNNQSGTYLVPYDLTDAEFEVRLRLETGLKLTANSDFYLTSQVGATIYTINPLPGDVNNPNIGQGDIVTAKFHFPSNWYAPYTYNGHSYWATTTEFNQFFSSFKVNFQLEANCANSPPSGVAHITEECFINPTPACANCKIPLCKVSDFTNINCPGCVLPGWNITSFNIKRVNIGFVDTDNNHVLDSHPPAIATTNMINASAAMIGDVIEGSITGYLSDGQNFGLDSQGNPVPVGFTFNNAGFIYNQGLLNFSGSVLQHMVFMGATGNLTLSNGTQTSFVVNATDILPQSNCIGIPMSIQNLISYGAQGLSDYSTITNIEIHPQFKIIHNLTDGNDNPYYSPRAITCFYYISGGNVFSDPCTNFPDANDHIATLLSSPLTRTNYQYWCTSFEGRFMGTGVDLKKTYLKAAENTHYNSIPSISLCSKSISYNYWVSVGKAYTNDPQSGPMNQTSANIFYNEIRSIGTLDELTFNFPPDYEPDKITFHNFDAGYDISNNAHTWYYDVNHNFDYPIYANGVPTNSVSIGTNFITIYPSQFISTLTSQPPYGSIPHYYSAFEENQYYVVSMYLRPKNCSALPELSDFNNNTIQADFSNYPLNTVTQTTVSTENVDASNLKNGLSFRNPNPVLNLTNPSGINTTNNLVSWDVALTTNAIAPSPEPVDEAIIRSAENTYVSFASPSGNFINITIDGNLTTYYNSNAVETLPVTIAGWTTDFANQSPGYALDFVGYNYNENQIISKQFKINADFNCANLSPGASDYITVYKGWNCFNAPTSVLSACKHDSVKLYFTVPQTEVQVSFQHETAVSSCSTTSASITFDPINGVTQSAVVELQSNPAGAYNYVIGSAYFTTDDGNGNITTTSMEPTFTGGLWIWNINLPGGIFSQPAVLHYQLKTSCGFESGQTIQHVTAKNSCGLIIANLTNTWTPQVISNLPEPDLIDVIVNDVTLNSCENTFSIPVTISNIGTVATAGYDTIVFPLPTGISYSGTNPGITLLGNALHITVPANINPGTNYEYDVPLSCTAITCTTIPLQFSVIHNVVYSCGTETCSVSSPSVVIATSAINISLPVYTVSDINTNELCNNGNTLYFSLNSNSPDINETITISVIDLNTETVLGSTSTTLPFTNSQSMSVTLNAPGNNLGFVFTGCTCESTITVETGNCICSGNDVPTIIQPDMQTTFSGDAFVINDNTTINTNTTFQDASVVFTGEYIIYVNNGATLTLNHAHLWACETMWGGIKVLPGGKLVVTNNSFIEDADSAIWIYNPVYAGGNIILNVDGATFNKNFTNITIDNYNSNDPNYPFIIEDAVFTKRDVDFSTDPPFTLAATPWPVTGSYKTIIDPGTINEHCIISDNYLSTDLKSPHASDNSEYGIRVTNIGNLNNNWNASSPVYNGIFIGRINGHGKNNMNLYDNLETGVYAVSSNFTNINSTFQYMVNVTPEPTLNVADGIGIFAFKAKGSDNMYKATIKEGLLFVNPLYSNKFYDNRCGVLINNYAVTEITNADVRSTQSDSPGTIGAVGFEVATVKYKSVAVTSNTITNVSNAVRFTGNQNNVFGSVSIDNNIIQAHYPDLPFLSSQFVRQGIFAETYSILNPTQSNTVVSTSNNILLDVDNGIITSQWQALKSVSANNYIRMIYRSGNLPTQIGIEHSYNSANEISNNTIEDDPGTSILYNDEHYKGIYSNSCLKENVTCNTITKMGRGIEFDNDHFGSVKFTNNTFNNNFKGYVLSNIGNIGNQSNLASPSDNKWYNFQSSSFHTFVYALNPSSSKLYTRSGLPYQPTQNGAAPGSIAYSLNSSLFNITSNSKEMICKPATPFKGSKIAMCDTCQYSSLEGELQRFIYSLYPNPAQNEIYISTNNMDIAEALVDITDITGKHILSKQVHFEKGVYKFDVNIENGAYLLTIENRNGVRLLYNKLIIMK